MFESCAHEVTIEKTRILASNSTMGDDIGHVIVILIDSFRAIVTWSLMAMLVTGDSLASHNDRRNVLHVARTKPVEMTIFTINQNNSTSNK